MISASNHRRWAHRDSAAAHRASTCQSPAQPPAIAAAAAFTILFLLIPKITLFLLFLPAAYLFYETAVVLSNAQDLVDRIAIEGIGGLNRDNVVEQATRGAPAFRALARFAIARLQNADV